MNGISTCDTFCLPPEFRPSSCTGPLTALSTWNTLSGAPHPRRDANRVSGPNSFALARQPRPAARCSRAVSDRGRRIRDLERLLATVLFVDIVGSTERAAALGDTCWRELLEAFFASVREVLQLYRGREISSAGDGFLAAFDGPARRSAAPAQSARPCARLASLCVAGFTPASVKLWATTSPASRCTSEPALQRLQVPARCWSHKPSGIWLPARACLP